MDLEHTRDGVTPRASRRLRRLLVAGLFGVMVIAVGLGTDAVVDARNKAAETEAYAALVERGGDSVEIPDPRHGHMHVESAPADPSPAQIEALEAQLAVAAQAVPDYDTEEEALAAGYVPVSPVVDGIGSHWTKWSLVDEPFDPAAPSQLLFEEVRAGHGPELVAFSYWVSSPERPEGFAGDDDQWHRHFGLCFDDGWLLTEGKPDRTSCPGDWMNGSDIWMLHAWIVPGLENRFGVFHTANPRLCERYCE